jgi:hypothetical protein
MQSGAAILRNIIIWVLVASVVFLTMRVNDSRHWLTQHHLLGSLLGLGLLLCVVGALVLILDGRRIDSRPLSSHPLEGTRS